MIDMPLSTRVERLGRESTLLIWQDACRDYDDRLLLQILQTGWNVDARVERAEANLQESIAALFSDFFPVSIDGVTREDARQLIEKTPPIYHIKNVFPSPNVLKSLTAYEALHLKFDVPALLAETLIRLQGKQGELIVYDILREERIKLGGGKTRSVAQLISDFSTEPQEANLFSAGLKAEIVHASEREVVLNITECEWARYFQERHPQVGYLMACSTDEVAYRASNKDLRMRRTSTLMEGGGGCDFHIYSVSENHEGQ